VPPAKRTPLEGLQTKTGLICAKWHTQVRISSPHALTLRLVWLTLAAPILWAASETNASVVFNWPSAPGWTAGTPAAGQTVTQSFTSVSPNDITVSINNNGAAVSGVNNLAGYPQINSTSTTGGLAGVNGLQLYATSSAVAGAYLRTTVSFSSPVTNLSFQIWDIDKLAGQFVDKVANLQALAEDGSTVGATSVMSAVAGFNTITGTGLSTVILGTSSATNTTNQGTIDVSFAGPITQFSFEWSNNDPARGQQAIGLGPLTYTIVPEIASYFLSAACCLAVVIIDKLLRRRRARQRRARS
jgi:hypothetical protein